jgi:hypothetical protein
MARPTRNTVNHGAESWDTAINDNFAMILDTPFPVPIYANAASLPSASAYEDCLAAVQDTDSLYISDGTSWNLVGVNVFTDLIDTPSSYSGQAGKYVKVKAAENGLEFADAGAGGEDISPEFKNELSSTEAFTGELWHDGKPIYVKEIDCGTLPNASGTTTLHTTAHNISNFLNVVRIKAVARANDGRIVPIPYVKVSNSAQSTGQSVLLSVNNANIYARVSNVDMSAFTLKVLLWYTKNTTVSDDANFLNYSTSERRTGLNWIDGSPIYRKVFYPITGPGSSTPTEVTHNISNLKEIIRAEGYIVRDSDKLAHQVDGVADNVSTHYFGYMQIDSTKIYWPAIGLDLSSRTKGHVILWYTKSDDVVPSPETYFGRDFQLEESVYLKSLYDGKHLFKKVFNVKNLPNNGASSISIDLGKNADIIWIEGVAKGDFTGTIYWQSLPFFKSGTGSVRYEISKGRLSIAFRSFEDLSAWAQTLIVYYTQPIPSVHRIDTNLTLYIDKDNGSSNGDGSLASPFDSLETAFNFLKYIHVFDDVTLKLASGTYSYSSALRARINGLGGLTIQGSDPISISLSSIQSTSGSSKNYSMVLNVSSVSNIAVGDWVAIYGASGGTHPESVEGFYEITAVDSTNTRITVSSKAYDTMPSGAVTATIKVLKTIVKFTGATDGLTLDAMQAIVNLKNLAVISNNSSSESGIKFSCEGKVKFDLVGVSGWRGYGVRASQIGYAEGQYFFASGNHTGVIFANGSTWEVNNTYCCSNDDGYGFELSQNSNFDSNLIHCHGNSDKGLVAERSSTMRADHIATCCNNGTGTFVSSDSVLFCFDVDTNDNNDNGIDVIETSVARVDNIEAKNNTNSGLRAWLGAKLFTNNETVTGNGTNYNPTPQAVDDPTFGNRGSWICNG